MQDAAPAGLPHKPDPRHLLRAHARAAAGLPRPDDRGHGPAHDRGRPRRAHPPVVGGDGVPAGRDRLHAPVRQAGRPLRAQAPVPGGHRDLRRRQRPVGHGHLDGHAHRLPGGPGRRRRRDHRAGHGHHRRRGQPAGAGPLPGLLRRGVRGGQRGRPAAGRLLHRPPVVALGVLRQPAARRRGPVRDQRGAAPLRPAPPGPHRLAGHGAAGHGHHLPGAPDHLGWRGVRLGLAGDPGPGPWPRWWPGSRSSWWSGARPSPPSRCACSACAPSTSPWR